MKQFVLILGAFFAINLTAQETSYSVRITEQPEYYIVTWNENADWAVLEVRHNNKLAEVASYTSQGKKGRHVVLKSVVPLQNQFDFANIFVTYSIDGVVFKGFVEVNNAKNTTAKTE